MPLLVNLRHLAKHSLSLKGELPVAGLDLDTRDEMIHPGPPLEYDFEVEMMDRSLLLQGRLALALDCECVRCLKKFRHRVELGHWACHVPLEGEEKAAVVNDCVDLTPYIREDILLELPQHPLCDQKCGGLQKPKTGKGKHATGVTRQGSSAWAKLDKLKF